MRILLVTEPSGGGSGKHVVQLAAGLTERGIDVSVAFSTVRAEPEFLDALTQLTGVRRFPIDMWREPTIKDFRSLFRLHELRRLEDRFDIIHAHSSKAGALTRLLPKRAARYVYTPHCFVTLNPSIASHQRRVFGLIEGALGKFRSDAVIAVGRKEEMHARKLGIPPDKIWRIPNGIGAVPMHSRAEARRLLSVPYEAPCVGFVGRLTYQKNPELFLRSFAMTLQRCPAAIAVVIGDGDQRDHLMALTERLEMGQAVRFVGWKSAQPLLSAFDLLALTSRYDAMPYVLAEAVHAGLPIVTTDVGGVEETVVHGANGWIHPTDCDPHEFAASMTNLLRDEQMRRDFGQHSYERKGLVSDEAMVSRTVALYEKLCAASASIYRSTDELVGASNEARP